MRKGRPGNAAPRGPGPLLALVAVIVLAAGLAGLLAAIRGSGSQAGRSAAELATRSGPSSPLAAPVHCPSCWRPQLRESWQIQLSSTPTAPFLPVAMIEVDGFDTPATTVAALHRSRPRRAVVCYIDAGTWENWRPDAGEFPRDLLGKNDAGWPGERWLDIARFHGALSRIMRARAAMCKHKGFNAVDFDNVDGFGNDTGFHLTGREQLSYNIFLANTAHRLGLAVALKNDLTQIPALLRYYDFAVDEQCFQFHECLTAQNGRFGLNEFVRAHKAVFEIEYRLRRAQFCRTAVRDHFNALRKHLSLGPWRQPCR
jgi:hypothetical protein